MVKHKLPSDFRQDGEYVDHRNSRSFLAPVSTGGWEYRRTGSGLDGVRFDKLEAAMQFTREVTGTCV